MNDTERTGYIAAITSEQPLDEQKLRDAINATGYEVKGVKSAPYEKKGFFSFLKK